MKGRNGDIYYNDSTLKVSEEKTLNDIDILNFNYVEKYNVSDFITVITKPISKPSTLRLSWNQLDIFNYYDEYNDWYYGYLFGASYMNGPYQSLNWSWAIGFSVTTICGILSMIPGIATILPGVVGISSGLITAPLSVTEWRKDYIWEYKVVQSSPETFVGYTAPYVWKSETRYDLNNGNTDYAQTSFNPYYYSSSFRDTLMHSIAYYFIY